MWELLLALGSGTGLVLILRWYWWRINAWSEISAMIAIVRRLAVGAGVREGAVASRRPAHPDVRHAHHRRGQHRRSGSTVTFLTAPEPEATLEAFYQTRAPGGPGWRRVSERLGYGRETIPGGALAWTNWIAGIVAVYASLFGIGKIIFGEIGDGHVPARSSPPIAFAWIARRSLRRGAQRTRPARRRRPAAEPARRMVVRS